MPIPTKVQEKPHCLVCEGVNTEEILAIPQFPIHCNVLWNTSAEAIQAPKGDIKLLFCHTCGHIFNSQFDPSLMEYDQDYENSLHFSPRFQQYAESLARHLAQSYDLKGKTVVEIGCGKGDFLKLLCQVGQCRGLGFDRSYVPAKESETIESVTFIQDFFSEQYAHYNANLICCRHVLEHISTPKEFLLTIHHAIHRDSETSIFFEVPNALSTIRDMAIWDIIYEHCSYFTLNSLTYLFNQCNFHVTSISEVYGEQFICLEALSQENLSPQDNSQHHSLSTLTSYIRSFVRNYYAQIEAWQTTLQKIREANQKAVIWGAGSKGVTLLNILKAQDIIQYAVDINPRKHYKYIPGSGQKIVPPDFLKEYRPDVVIGMNPLYQAEIKAMLDSYHLTPDLICKLG